jgi:hypothetical protein
VILVGRERQARGEIGIERLGIAVEDAVFLALVDLAPQLQAQYFAGDRAVDVELALIGVTRVAMLLQRGVDAHRAAPLPRHFLGDDVDDAAHGIGSIERRHRSAHHLDALDGLQRRNVGLLEAGIAIGPCIARALALAVHQDQGVGTGQAANEDVLLAGGTGNGDALDITSGHR